QFVEKKFARDTQRARLEWLKARTFVTTAGGVTGRKKARAAPQEVGRKGQGLRGMARDPHLLTVEIEVIAAGMRLGGAPAPIVQVEQPAGGEADLDHP